MLWESYISFHYSDVRHNCGGGYSGKCPAWEISNIHTSFLHYNCILHRSSNTKRRAYTKLSLSLTLSKTSDEELCNQNK